MGKIIDGNLISAKVKDEVKNEVEKLKMKGITPCLAVIIVGSDPASRVYVNNKKKACEYTGMKSLEFALPEETSQEELLNLIDKLNEDKQVNGILCQLPLPKSIDEETVLNKIAPEKDIDAFHPLNVGHIMIGDAKLLPCTPAGVVEMLDYSNIDLKGKTCAIIGRSNIVGKPMAMLMVQRDATVTVCHSKTKNLSEITRNSDIIISSAGRKNLITADMVKDGAVVIDVSINRDENGKLCGDVDYENVKEKASYITPVPGGVGPMTISVLMKNTLMATKSQNGEA